ncbi:SusC/RagA family TonB-linked outer membrane protein [Fodinibius sediminis]|uniref:TonB-linked outer membrane protein, SusC/RagA family n=1 Tax=Fodinibius sediminis TaxID=1214077 RepID=A0A521ECY3_9BACT|nr:TonB-dependent receptor [Fodinibius sediminis]SMO81786.1 TonB-linked outer membrane protein, SusC/RagA family [Fodinibius sediminis]
MGKLIQTTFLTLIYLGGIVLCAAMPAHAQQVNGTVTDDATGEPIPGANIYISELQTGAATNAEGQYEITDIEPGTYTLVASYVGYEEYETTFNISEGQSLTMDIALSQRVEIGEELVVVGYGTQEKEDVTGSVSSVSADELNELSISSVDQGLQGRTAGVVVTQSGTKPGSGANVRIRGNRSINASNEPLYVVDGVPISGGLRDINPSSIQSIEVLKDASATAIYGARGSNGVVIVTTNRGYDGDLSVTYNGSIGFSKALDRVDRMNGEEYAELNREAHRAAGAYTDDSQFFEPGELEKLNNGEWVDYQDMILQTGIRHNHNLGISGGNENTKFHVSFGGLQEQGILEPEKFSRYNIQINLDMKVTDNLTIGTTTLGSYSIQDGGDRNFYSEALNNSPLGSPFDENGNLVFQPINDGQRSNPLIEVLPDTYVDEEKRQRILSNVFAEYSFTDNLSFRMNFAPDIRYERDSDFQASRSRSQFMGPSAAQKSEDFIFEYTWENIVEYEQAFADKHTLALTGLFSIQEQQVELSSMEVRGIPIQSMEHYNFGAAQDILGTDTSFEKWNLLSTMLRANYNYDDRYLLTATGRVDGSSRFGDNHKYGVFPSVAFSWNIANETFFSREGLFSDLRLRISWGETGQTGISPYQTLALLGRTTYNYGDDLAYGYQPSQIANPDLKWETTATTNIGLEFGILDSRITGSVDVYRQDTKDLLLERQLPPTSGYGSILENVGSTRNTGIEVGLSTVNIQSGSGDGFQWTTDLNFSSNKEEIVELYGGGEDDVGNEWFIGEPINVFYEYDQVGVWQTDEESVAAEYNQIPGEIRVRDVNGDGQINAADRTIVGQEMPKFTGGMTNRFSYKGIDLSVFLYASFGNTIFSGIHSTALVGRYNEHDINYWTPDNPVNRHPRPTINREYPVYNDARLLYDGSFIKVRNVQLGYNLPFDIVQNVLGAQSLRIYASADQPFISSPYVRKHGGIDPENPGTGTPARWQMNFGINLTF